MDSARSSSSSNNDYRGSALPLRTCVSQFKGVVPQHNGKWGAQIYVSHHRLWLGTFDSQEDAAIAYDRATLKLRSVDGRKNLLSKRQCHAEVEFQDLFSNEQIIQMIKDHSYPNKLNAFLTSDAGHPHPTSDNAFGPFRCYLSPNPQHLFDKEVTPSDVGKLNRLVIPKQHAERNFPHESVILNGNEELVFRDDKDVDWRFRYSFWKSSQSYVLTRGWSKFVRAKGLRAGDIVSFQRCKVSGMLYITVTQRNSVPFILAMNRRFGFNAGGCHSLSLRLSLQENQAQKRPSDLQCQSQKQKHQMELVSASEKENGADSLCRSVKLFGVEIGKRDAAIGS